MALAQGTPVNMTVTSLDSLPANNGQWLTGWGSDAIACDGTNVVDMLISVKVTRTNTNLQAGVLNVYVIPAHDNGSGGAPNWPDVFSSGVEGTQGACTIHSTLLNGGPLMLLGSLQWDAASSSVVTGFQQRSVAALFGGTLPSDIILWITSNGSTSTNAVLAGSTNNKVTYTPVTDA